MDDLAIKTRLQTRMTLCREDMDWTSTTLTDSDALIDLPDIGVIGKLHECYRATELEPK